MFKTGQASRTEASRMSHNPRHSENRDRVNQRLQEMTPSAGKQDLARKTHYPSALI